MYYSITAEGGGGETATNVFVRGLPSGGQYVFNPLQYDGMPLMSTFGLNSSAHDVYARPDIGFKGVEFVRGGSAILYGAGSVAGIINYTSKTGDTNPE
ncbi:TonB-dependent receptor plug domain-containing protein [Zobellia laminariae]|uniref:TonB-dependent receptor plug domain-containing protein n=1 Tax=Zobellia laminariae TaxID=248906 RepID=UPI0026F47156|nr:TonB-dependent receptor plug domain-containing protein [Zobellia laminariae]WKX78399.1 TonB-dependent receptor plug domain-containing protein [Zobellia laminariae]